MLRNDWHVFIDNNETRSNVFVEYVTCTMMLTHICLLRINVDLPGDTTNVSEMRQVSFYSISN